ncbi:hypothetical protein H9657_18255 [Cellulomonas sp. Sa3CUA2]|uniref:DUF2029 domain-containing protein n=1 Tax=Cellulomonas avistercoris TaxID=2762242 RepID=A0ABR8QIJ3_9CELL|nr:hypothetical protein [Cellulomonas avistercoris]MBD7920219.1 hypothetical protein [Cellulomonas avistercoris]
MQTIAGAPSATDDLTEDASRRRLERLLMAAILVVGTVVSVLRVPRPHLDVVWAEDAHIFLLEAIEQGPWAVLLEGYAGYQHLVPRLVVALTSSWLPTEYYAIGVFWICALLTALAAVAVFVLSRDLVDWIPARLGLAAVTLLLPLAAQEVLGNLADIHSYCMWLVPWLVLATPRTRRAGWGWAVVMLLCAMTEVQAVIFLALVPFRLRARDRFIRPVLGALVVGAAAQLWTTVTDPRPSTAAWPGLWSIVKGWLVNTVLPLVQPDPAVSERLLLDSGVLVPLLVALLLAVATGYALWRGTPAQRLLTVTLALASAAVYAGGAVADGSWVFWYGSHANVDHWEGLLNSRYGVSSGMFAAAVVPVSVAVLVRRGRERGAQAARRAYVAGGAVLAVLVVVFALASTQTVSSRRDGQWSPAVRDAVESCADLPPDTEAALPVSPGRVLFLTCEQVLEHA